MLFEIAKRHGLDLEEEAEYGSRKYLEKQDFILAKQKEQLAAQQNKLDELTLKVNGHGNADGRGFGCGLRQGGGGRDGRGTHRDPEGRYADDRGHEEVGAVPGAQGSAGHREYAAAPFGHRAGQVPQDHADHRHSFAGEAPEAGCPAEGQGAGQGESTGFRSATVEPFAGRTDPTEAIRTNCRRKIGKLFSIIVRGDAY